MNPVLQTQAPVAASPRQRIAWIDAARGIGIVLVVFGHVMRSLIAQGIAPDDRLHRLVDSLIYDFHMPLFFVLSGLFARPPAAGQRWPFLRGLIQGIAYPYLLWSLVQGLLVIGAGAHASHPVGWTALAAILWDPIAQFWFLYMLLLMQALLLVPGRFTLLALVPVGMAAAIWCDSEIMIVRLGYDLPFFAAGLYLAAPRATAWLDDGRRAVALAIVAWLIFALLFLVSPHGGGKGMVAHAAHWAMGLAGAAGTMAVARLIAAYAKPLLALGRASMPIYLLHVMAAAALRTLLLLYWPDAGEGVYAVILMLIGLLVPYAVFRASERWGVDRLLGFSRPARGSARLGATGAATAGARS
jgi:fucose 4-O-acetylase-like acetyltransferase